MYLKTQERLRQFCERARTSGYLAMDLEFVPEHTYYPQLALIQLAVDDDLRLVDPLSAFTDAPADTPDLSVLEQLVNDPAVVKIVHAGAQDLGIFYHRTHTIPQTVFDTQVAAAFLGLGNQLSYANMVFALFNQPLKKGQSFSNWLHRPLSRAQETYALEDVKYLCAAYRILSKRLQERQRTHWFDEAMSVYRHPHFYETQDTNAHTRVKKGRHLKPSAQAALTALAAWRENEARHRNVPRRRVLGDHVLVEVANRRPANMEQLQSIRGMGHLPAAYGRAMIDCISRVPAKAVSTSDRPERRLDARQRHIADFLYFCLKSFCDDQDVPAAYLGNKADMERLVADYYGADAFCRRRHPVLQGWRGEIIGEGLLQCLAGQTAVRIHPESEQLVFERVQPSSTS